MKKSLLIFVITCLAFSARAEIDLLKLQGQQKADFMHALESGDCTCGCGMKLWQCLVEDQTCPVSPGIAQSVFDRMIAGVANPNVSRLTSRQQTASSIDQQLVGAWIKRSSGGSGIYYENTVKMAFSADGRIAYGTGTVVSGGHAGFSIRDGGDNPTELGNWRVNKKNIVDVVWDDGTAANYPYEVFDYFGEPALAIDFGNGKTYFKSY